MITADGWIDWAKRDKPGPANKVNGGVNQVRGIFLHSADGFEPGLWGNLARNAGDGKDVSWHLSNLFDGTLHQHYPLTAQCWHATAANNNYVGMEHEGKPPGNPSLTPAQLLTSKRVVAEIAAWKGWTPSRPKSEADTTHTLWEHKEVTRLGGSGTDCPSGRIPWVDILQGAVTVANINQDGSQRMISDGKRILIFNANIPVLAIGDVTGDNPGALARFEGTAAAPGGWRYLKRRADGVAIWDQQPGL